MNFMKTPMLDYFMNFMKFMKFVLFYICLGGLSSFLGKKVNLEIVKFRELIYMNRSYISQNVKFREIHFP